MSEQDRQTSTERRRGLVRFALGIVALVLVLTLLAGFGFYLEPVRIGTFLARSGLERAGLEKSAAPSAVGAQTYFASNGGDGAAPLVLLHGIGTQAGSWVRVAGELAVDRPVVVVDLAGHGDSEPRDGPLDFATTLAGLDAVLDAVLGDAASRRAILVGNSFGGWTALRYALERPERVERVVLVDASGLRADFPEGVTLTPTTREEAAALVRSLGFETVPAGFVLDDMLEEIAAGPIERQAAGFRDDDALDGRLRALSVPVDLIWGLDDALTPPSLAERFLEELPPGARLIELEDCGHLPQQQCPARFADALRGLLE